jgi:hypothetical protein
MKTKENIQLELESWTDNYAEFVLNDCTTPFDEIKWLVDRLLDSEHKSDIIDLLRTFKD